MMPFKIVMLVPASNISVIEELRDVLIGHPEIAIRIISDEEFELLHKVEE